MSYALNLNAEGRVLSATFPQYAPKDAVVVDTLPGGDLTEYCYVNGEFLHDPLPVPQAPSPEPTAQDDTDALMVDHEYRLTLLELGLI